MLEVDGFNLKRFESYGVTPEEARDNAIRVLSSVKFNRSKLEDYIKPIEEMDYFTLDIIESLLRREEDVRFFAAQYNNDLSHIGHAGALEWYLNP